MITRPWLQGTVLLGLLSGLIVVSCGGSRATDPTTEPPALGANPNLVEADDIRKAAPGSPRRTVLTWAQAIQFVDPRTVLTTYTEAAIAEAGVDRIERAVHEISSTLGRPEFVQTTFFGSSRVRLRAFLVSFDSARQPVYRQPVTFDLVRRGEGWLLDDATTLLEMDDALKAQRRDRRATGTSSPGGS